MWLGKVKILVRAHTMGALKGVIECLAPKLRSTPTEKPQFIEVQNVLC